MKCMRNNKLSYEELVEKYKQELMADAEKIEQIERRMEERLASKLDQNE